ncbi:transcription antitermination factor NusB [Sulfurospirillum multivorans]|uniref:Transcription antitermination protein NusB n=2 Tax=Sulfurospirillum multivorans TaxID=66821 RepID=A0AA86DYV1_SULMK|nr:transcription antitermination factor NusB [Sulfurospirillum multivorans]AHJ13688.1 transcription termination protein NusB [Sulfurospirillum multivorans DSM 12446]QEH07178.1 transcription termination protein NusB [Sulfurospirillum multivorans]
MATRHQARESIITLLYAEDIGNPGIEKFIDELFEEKKIRNQQKEFALGLYHGVKEHLVIIDEAINLHLKEWNLSEIGTLERAILRLGAYEVLYSELDNAVIINEAIELAKKLCNETSPKFINGVLDAICKDGEAK